MDASFNPATAFYDLYSGFRDLQTFALTDQLDAYRDCKSRVRSSVQLLIETRSDTPASHELISAVLNVVEDSIGRENCFYTALSSNLDHLPLYTIGEEEAEPGL